MDAQIPNDASSETAVEGTTEWTVMGFLAGDNNLNEEMVLTLQEIVALSKQNVIWPRVKILAQLDPSGLGLPTQRYVFDTPNKPPDKRRYLDTYQVAPPNQYNSQNTGNPDVLSGFVKWAVDEPTGPQAVADRYMLILSGHGSGSTEDFLMKDENPVDSLSIPELEEALEDVNSILGKNVDVLGMDCCFMSMVEVCYQIRNYVDHVVAAESLIPDFGWPYHRILARAEDERWPPPPQPQDPVEPHELSKLIVEEFIDYYSDYDRTAGRSVDLAWIKLAEMDALKESISALGLVLKTALDADPIDDPKYKDQIVLAHWDAQTYKFDQFVDIRDFCKTIEKRFGNLESNEITTGVIQACTDVVDNLNLCIGLSGCSGFSYQHSYGLSIYFPWACLFDSYKWDSGGGSEKKFEFAKNNDWVDFLEAYLIASRRPKRAGMDDAYPGTQLTEIDKAADGLATSVSQLNQGRVKKFAKSQLRRLNRIHDVGGSDDMHTGSRYHRSRYHRSRYHRSRWPGDRETSVKNLTPVVGKAYHP